MKLLLPDKFAACRSSAVPHDGRRDCLIDIWMNGEEFHARLAIPNVSGVCVGVCRYPTNNTSIINPN